MSLIPSIVEQYEIICERYSSARTQAQRSKQRLTTLKGMLGSFIKDVQHFILQLASPLVDADTFQLNDFDSRSMWQLYHNEDLAVLLNLPPFHSPEFTKLQGSTLTKMKARANFSSIFPTETKCAMERYVQSHVTRPMIEMHQHNRAGHHGTPTTAT